MSDQPLLLAAADEPLLLPAPAEPLLLTGPDRSAGAPPGAKPPAGKHSRRPYVIAAVVFLVLLLIGWFFHHLRANQAQEANQRARDRIPTVGTIEVRQSPSSTDLLLPGSITPITEASLFARSSGYLRARYVDIGDVVHRGQVLAEIDSPDLDQEVAQGRAAVAQARQQLTQAEGTVVDARARVELARVTYERAAVLGHDEAVAQQEVDQRRQELDTAKATLASNVASVGAARDNIRAGEANAQRLVVLQDFEKLRAPFDGIVTARSVDVGALIGSGGSSMGQSSQPSNATSGGGTATSSSASSSGSSGASSTSGSSSGGTTSGGQSGELFRIGQVDRLRVFVSVPQENASDVAPGHDASVFVQGFPDAFAGSVTRNAKSLDPSARTLLTEVQIDNARHVLMPGMYAQVRFHSPRSNPPLLVPGEAVIARADGLSIAVIEELRPEDRERLPKTLPKEDDEKQEKQKKEEKKQGKSDSSGGAAIGGGSTKEDSKGGGAKGGESKGDDSKGGDSKGDDSKGGGAKGDGAKGGDSKGGDAKGGDAKGGDAKGGDSKGGDSKGGDSKGGNSKGDDSKGGDSRGGSRSDETSRDPGQAKRIHLQQVKTGRDYGTEIEIIQGLQPGAVIVANPGDDVMEDALVLPRMKKPTEGPGKIGGDAPPQGNQSPSRTAPTKGRS